jgi:hypothetical protein
MQQFSARTSYRGPSLEMRARGRRWSTNPLEKAKRFAAHTSTEAMLCASLWNIDDVHGPITLAGNEQFVTAECHVHRLTANLDRGLLPD